MKTKTTTFENINNEGAEGFVPTDPREAKLDAELRAMRDAWTVEVTKARREAWNKEVMKYKAAGKKINLLELESKMGFKFSDMKRHIVRHAL